MVLLPTDARQETPSAPVVVGCIQVPLRAPVPEACSENPLPSGRGGERSGSHWLTSTSTLMFDGVLP